MTRLEQALRWAANHSDGCSIPARHYLVLKENGYATPEDEGGYVTIQRAMSTSTIRARPEREEPG